LASPNSALQSLARGGYLERTHDAFDARRTLFRLSTRGRALYRRVASSTRARERTLLAGLTAVERRQLDRLLAKLQRAVAGD
jgi:DNA-binding MarR family transcriptional regulator